jgi:chromosome segregation ATPase
LALTLLLLTSGVPAYGSDFGPWATSQDDDARAIEQALAELAARRKEVEALRVAVGARDDRIAVLERIVADQDKLVQLWKQAATERATASAADAKLEASYQESVKRYEAELARVREERDSARRTRWTIGGLCLAVGAVVGFVAARD